MESNTFKSVAFGGFDKQDVVRYIESAAREHAEELRRLQDEIDSLRTDNDALLAQKEELAAQNEELSVRLNTLEAQDQEYNTELAKLRQEVESLSAEAETLRTAARDRDQLQAEVLSLRTDADAYRHFRNQIGDIECAARKRAAELEGNTLASLQTMVGEFSGKYQQLSNTFDVTSSYVTTELRKLDVMLSQLPRALDQLGTELNTLAASLRAEETEA